MQREERKRLFDEALNGAREMATAGYYWIASLYVNKARLYGRVTSKHLRELGVVQETGGRQ